MRRRKKLPPVPPIGYIYFIAAPEIGRVKIGWSLLNPDSRFAALDTASPVALEKWALMRGRQFIERELHARFAIHSVKGEWFRLVPEVESFVVENARPWRGLLAEIEKADREAMECGWGPSRLSNARRVREWHATRGFS
jgi:hypothetical protein